MVKAYSREPEKPENSAKSQGANLRVHYKNAVEVAAAIRHMPVGRAKTYLNNVLEHKEAVPFKHFKGGRGRHAQAKNMNTPGSTAGWPRNAVKMILNLVENAETNAVAKGLDVESLVINHSQVNMAPKGRRRTYRAHGRIGPYLRVPSHIEIILTKKRTEVEKADEPAAVPRLHKRVLAKRIPLKRFVKVGGGAA